MMMTTEERSAAADWMLPWTGGCLCGALRFRVSAPPMLTMACHCRGCQKLTGGPYSLSVLVPEEGFAVTQGEPVPGGLRGEHQQLYCDDCKSWVFTRPNTPMPMVNVRATMLDQPCWVVPFVDIAASDKLPGVSSGAGRSFDGFPEPAAFAPLMTAFEAEGCRPTR